MITSMTGFGSGTCDDGAGGSVTVELKSVNGRFLKVSWRLPSVLSRHEQVLEGRLRQRVRRGSVSATIVMRRSAGAAAGLVNEEVVRSYQRAFARLGLSTQSIPLLPGVIEARDTTDVEEGVGEAVTRAFDAALAQLVAMRQQEGEALVAVLEGMVERIDGARKGALQRAPRVVEEYRDKLLGRLSALLADGDAGVDPQLLAREVAVVADRSDITEEIDRLGAHLEQARALLRKGGEAGRTLDFLAQEMHREVNTMGAKSADAELSRHVVSLKADIERFKEQVANVE